MDNRSQGAVAYGVDTASGALLPGAAKGTDQVFTIHPLSQLRAVGFALPGFREAVALAVDAHGKAFPHFPTVGWDLALTDDGPMIVEMNIQWNSDHHLPNEPFIGETRYTDCVLAHLERHWPRCVPEESDSSPGAEAIATRD
jgi:hypothetical protein